MRLDVGDHLRVAQLLPVPVAGVDVGDDDLHPLLPQVLVPERGRVIVRVPEQLESCPV